MIYDELFIDYNNLPRPLDKCELYFYFEQYKKGDLKARDIIIVHNIRLVINQVNLKFSNTQFEKEDLVSIGLIGLVKSVDTFNIDMNYAFSSYAIKCINNEILGVIRKNKKRLSEQSIYSLVGNDSENNKILFEILKDGQADFVKGIEDSMVFDEIRQLVHNLPERDKKIVTMYFGFDMSRLYTQLEIATELGISQAVVSRTISTVVKSIRLELQKQGLVDKNCQRKKLVKK